MDGSCVHQLIRPSHAVLRLYCALSRALVCVHRSRWFVCVASRSSTDGRMRLEFNCNWKLAVENYCESYHLPWVDPGLNSYSRIEDHYNIVARNRGAGQGTELFEFTERAGLILPRFPLWPAAQLKTAELQSRYFRICCWGYKTTTCSRWYCCRAAPHRRKNRLQIYYLGDAPDSCEFFTRTPDHARGLARGVSRRHQCCRGYATRPCIP